MRRFILTPAILTLAICHLAYSAIIAIPQDFHTIQAGIDHAEAGDTVLVAEGRYVENLHFPGRPITVASLFLINGDENLIDSTIIDGNRGQSVVRIDRGEGSNCILTGFTLTGGTGSLDLNNDLAGGGIHCFDSSPTLTYLCVRGNSADFGAGIFLQRSSPLVEHVKVFDNTASGTGGGIYCSRVGTDPIIRACQIFRNRAWYGGAMGFWNGTRPTLTNLTIAFNSGQMYGGALVSNSNTDNNCIQLTNSILWGNGAWQIVLGPDAAWQDSIIATWSDIEGGEDSIRNLSNGQNIFVWGDGNINEDPLFVAPDTGDFHLSDDSPCINAGDPDAEPDPDGSRADMGALPCVPHFNAFIGGQILDAETSLPISDAEISGHSNRFGVHFDTASDSIGCWGCRVRSYRLDSLTVFRFDIAAAGYLRDTMEMEVAYDDSVWIETRLNHGEFQSNPDNLTAEVDSGGSTQLSLTLHNNGNGPLTWQAACRSAGDAGNPAGSLRRSYSVADTTQDDRIQGAVFANDHFYLCGANGSDTSMIYVLDRGGSLISSFRQCGHARYGFRDLEWDGNLIWGSGEDSVYGFTPEGRVMNTWRGPYNPNSNLAWDSDHNLLWLSGTTTNIAAYDEGGHAIGQPLNPKGLRIYGMAYWPQDPDGYKLYILDESGNSAPSRIFKMNTETGDTMLVQIIPHVEGSTGMNGLFITNQFDEYGSCVMLAVDNIAPAGGGDQLRIYQLHPNTEWLTITPESGEVPAGGESQVSVNLRAAAEDNRWSFKPGVYEGEIVFMHDASGGRAIVPIHLTVREPNCVGLDGYGAPSSFHLNAPYPNPFNGRVRLSYGLPEGGLVRLNIFDISGREVVRLVDGIQGAGVHAVAWTADAYPSGVYLLRLEHAGQARMTKMTLLK